MQYWFGVAAALLGLGVDPAFAADVATWALGADKKTVTVTASNPYPQVSDGGDGSIESFDQRSHETPVSGSSPSV